MPSEKKKTGASGGKKHSSRRNGPRKRLRANKKKLKGQDHNWHRGLLVTDPKVLEEETRETEERIALGVHPKAAVRGVLNRRG